MTESRWWDSCREVDRTELGGGGDNCQQIAVAKGEFGSGWGGREEVQYAVGGCPICMLAHTHSQTQASRVG